MENRAYRLELKNSNGKIVLGRTVFGCNFNAMACLMYKLAEELKIDTSNLTFSIKETV